MIETRDDALNVVNRLLDDGEDQRTEQVRLIESLTERGERTAEAERLLREIEGTLAVIRVQQSCLQATRRRS